MNAQLQQGPGLSTPLPPPQSPQIPLACAQVRQQRLFKNVEKKVEQLQEKFAEPLRSLSHLADGYAERFFRVVRVRFDPCLASCPVTALKVRRARLMHVKLRRLLQKTCDLVTGSPDVTPREC